MAPQAPPSPPTALLLEPPAPVPASSPPTLLSTLQPTSNPQDLWRRARPLLFESNESGLDLPTLKKYAAYCDRAATRIAAFGSNPQSAADFDLLKEPMEEFSKSYVVFLGALTSMGGGRTAGASLREEILKFGDGVTGAYAAVEGLVRGRDCEKVRTDLVLRVGVLCELLGKWEGVPRNNAVAVRRRLLGKVERGLGRVVGFLLLK